jgi:hypothetical protein
MQGHATVPSLRSSLNARVFRNVRPFARVPSLLQGISKGCQG